MKQTVLVTGGAGFIGSHYIRHLLHREEAIEVINADALTYSGNPLNLKEVEKDPRYRFVRADLTDRRQVRELFGYKIDFIVHFAAETHVDQSIKSAEPFIRSNVLGTFNLLEEARRAGVQKFVHISTDEVYGSIPAGKAGEDAPLAPSNPYSASKASSDLLCLSYFHTYHFPVVITRCTNNYGPNQYPEKLIPCFIRRLLRSEPLLLYGDGRQERDWLYVGDHCRAIEKVRKAGKCGEIYHIGAEHTVANLEVARRLCELMGKSTSLIQFVEDRPGHDFRYSLDTDKIRRELNWEPSVPFREGLEKTVNWYLSHPEWWESIERRRSERGD
ncbi:dTDP-glucose 4,6-dehydratase [Thermoactinomyces sp. CICC 10522]|uniref:dTDP-glucose 4,6-dehydratase n=1 Tax=Thermoactinomyces sp. CICC 10522 TaxID=2767427 RepID=UPI0018DC0222|nr:dTDP-glucose 4,6-dehydratase [Thermoactinomyces sp. CICC 10522]MBH8604514.1 dTDP-glucose 4,6-dehydratase [Thermoactinomyces sp. CICC 10522]